jgi:hypothetical protein
MVWWLFLEKSAAVLVEMIVFNQCYQWFYDVLRGNELEMNCNY